MVSIQVFALLSNLVCLRDTDREWGGVKDQRKETYTKVIDTTYVREISYQTKRMLLNLNGLYQSERPVFRMLQDHFCQGANNSGRLWLTQCSFIKTLEGCQLPLLPGAPSPCWRSGLPAKSAALVWGPVESLSPPQFLGGSPSLLWAQPCLLAGADDNKTFCKALHSSVLI